MNTIQLKDKNGDTYNYRFQRRSIILLAENKSHQQASEYILYTQMDCPYKKTILDVFYYQKRSHLCAL